MPETFAHRFILAFWTLKASVEEDIGRAVIGILQPQYPDDKITESPSKIGGKLIAIARRELQGSDTDALDAVQDLLTKFIANKTDFTASKAGPGTGAKTWRDALGNIYSNMRRQGMSGSFKKHVKGDNSDEEKFANLLWKLDQIKRGTSKITWTPDDEKQLPALKKKLDAAKIDTTKIKPEKLHRKNIVPKSIDEAFGKAGEDGAEKSGGEGRLPQGDDTWLGKSLDDQASIKKFFNVIDAALPRLKAKLPPDQAILLDTILEGDPTDPEADGGIFVNDVNANMNQSRAFKQRLEDAGMSADAARVTKRPAYLGDLRAKLLGNLRKFVESDLKEGEFEALKEEFFSDIDPSALEKQTGEKRKKTYQHWRDIDFRKRKKMLEQMKEGKDVDLDALDKLQSRLELQDELGRLEYVMDRRKLTKEESRRHDEITRDLKKRDVVIDAIPPVEHDLGSVDVLAELKWIEKNGKLTPEQDKTMDEVWDAVMDDGIDANSVVPKKPKNGNKLSFTIARIALLIARRP